MLKNLKTLRKKFGKNLNLNILKLNFIIRNKNNLLLLNKPYINDK